MRRTRTFFWALGGLIAISLAAGAVLAHGSSADDDDEGAVPGMMGPGMMGGMMGPGMMGSGMMGGMMGSGMMGGCMGGGGQGMMGHGMMMMGRLQALGLTADQWTRIRAIHLNTQKQVIPKQAELKVKTLELRELMLSAKPNESKIQAKVNETNALRGQIQMLWTKSMLQARAVLTPEQLQKFLNPSWKPVRKQQRPMPGPKGGMMGGGMMNR